VSGMVFWLKLVRTGQDWLGLAKYDLFGLLWVSLGMRESFR